MSKLVNLKFKCPYKNFKLELKNLSSKGGSDIRLPLMDYIKKEPLPDDKQIISGLYQKEVDDLMRCWPNLFEVIKPKAKRKETEEQCLDINQQ